MQYQVIENVHKLVELNAEMAKRLQAVQARLWEAWTGRQLEAAALWVDAGIKQLRLLGDVQKPHDMYAGQAQLVQEYMERATEYCRQSLGAFTDLQRDVGALAASPPMPPETAVRETPKPVAPVRPVAEATPTAEPDKTPSSVP